MPLPIHAGETLRLYGPDPEQSSVAVEIVTDVDQRLSALRFCLAALCDTNGDPVAPVELTLLSDGASATAAREVPATAVVRAFRSRPATRSSDPQDAQSALLRTLTGPDRTFGPLLYCRKRRVAFFARSPLNGEELIALGKEWIERLSPLASATLPIEWLCTDAATPGDANARLYGGAGGRIGEIDAHSLDQLILDQGGVVALAEAARESDPARRAALARAHACVDCAERQRCHPQGGGYAYAADRLALLSVTAAPLGVAPLGVWNLLEAARIIGAASPAALSDAGPEALRPFRVAGAEALERYGPARLLVGETDGRELLEIARLKLGLVAGALEQLDRAWSQIGRPHLAWNDETVRVSWGRPAAVPASAWGLAPILRKVGLHPACPAEPLEGAPVSFPPAFTAPGLLAPDVIEAARHFGTPRPAAMFVKSAKLEGDRLHVLVLVEELGVAWRLFSPADVFHIEGRGWQGVFAPQAERNPDDGEGLPFRGRITGAKDAIKPSAQLDGCACTWFPRFAEAVDLHALGVLALECLLSHDERRSAAWRDAFAQQRDEVRRVCEPLPQEQRDARVRTWLGERCEEDSPTAFWSRRNLLDERSARNAARLDAFPPALWHAILTWGLRMTTSEAGFSYCAVRSDTAPRADGLLLPLLELRGLLATLDDHLFGRSAPAAAVRAALK